MTTKKRRTHKYNNLSIDIYVQNWEFTARNNFGMAHQESNPQSVTAYNSELYQQF